MKSFKRILVLALAVAMCLTAFAISSSAANQFNPEVKLLARYNETGDKIIVTVETTEKCGALMGTLSFPQGAALDIKLADSKFIENVDADDNAEFYSKTDSTVKFAVVTDKVTEGSKTWADIYFDVASISDNMVGASALTFELNDVQVCNIEEEFVDGVAVSPAKVEIPFVALRALGAKKESGANAILFGSRVDLTGATASDDFKAATSIKVGDKVYDAVSCGYAYGYTNNVSANDFANFGVELDDKGEVVALNSMTLVKVCKKYKYWSYTDKENGKDGYFVYTLKVNNIKDATREISVKPYVVYADEDGNKMLIQGNVISRSCDGVANAPAFLGVTGSNLW